MFSRHLPIAIVTFLSNFFWSGLALAGSITPPGGELPGGADLKGLIGAAISLLLNILGLLAAVIIVIGGVRLIFSQGEEEGKEAAKKTILYAVIGLIVVLLAKAIVTFVIGFG